MADNPYASQAGWNYGAGMNNNIAGDEYEKWMAANKPATLTNSGAAYSAAGQQQPAQSINMFPQSNSRQVLPAEPQNGGAPFWSDQGAFGRFGRAVGIDKFTPQNGGIAGGLNWMANGLAGAARSSLFGDAQAAKITTDSVQQPIWQNTSQQQQAKQLPIQSNITAYGQLGPQIGSSTTAQNKTMYGTLNDRHAYYAHGGQNDYSTVNGPTGNQIGSTGYGDVTNSRPFAQDPRSMSHDAQAAYQQALQRAKTGGGSVRGFTAGQNGANGFGFTNVPPAQATGQTYEQLQQQLANGARNEKSDVNWLAQSKSASPSWEQFNQGAGGLSAHRTWNDKAGPINSADQYGMKLDQMKNQQFGQEMARGHLKNEGIAAANMQPKGQNNKIVEAAAMKQTMDYLKGKEADKASLNDADVLALANRIMKLPKEHKFTEQTKTPLNGDTYKKHPIYSVAQAMMIANKNNPDALKNDADLQKALSGK